MDTPPRRASPTRTDDELMRGIERAAALNLRAYVATFRRVAPGVGAASLPIAGGIASFAGIGSPLSTVKGTGPRWSTRDLHEVESFFRRRDAPSVTIETAPWLTDRSKRLLSDFGYSPAGYEHVVVATLVPARTGNPPRVHVMHTEPWSELMRRCFELPDDAESRYLAAAAAHLDDAQLLAVRDDDRWVACGQSVVYGDVAIFGCDGTLPEARGRGAQTALIQKRLEGLDPGMIAVAEVAPGSASERSYLRCRFRVAYARIHYVLSLR